ncbi:N-acetylmuramoyl-L-alanine amidase [Hypericibacter adhaerens]|uniref:N-acetylmuramoyl-L-alanine amidase n=1 Tax=Hypericibacter adhaerens TaxID=2602016 RepID=A0A5J6MWI2_9PROT|nr:N-acetylmuramoyl-L-alanine amidase [Hypericibacter adhaerens]QEX21514.1 N-acetylmuramoyl-L-alanine amidase [Hypericibacter adhaerens]
MQGGYRPVLVFIVLAALALLGGLSAPALAAVDVLGIRLGVHPDKTRVVLDLSGGATYRTLLLADPYRLVVDLEGIEWQFGPEGPPLGKGLVSGLRYGTYSGGTQRLVLDLSGPVALQQSALIPGSGTVAARLVLDLVPTGAGQFQAGATGGAGPTLTALPDLTGGTGSDPAAGTQLAAAVDPGDDPPTPGLKPDADDAADPASAVADPSPLPAAGGASTVALLGFPPPVKPASPGLSQRPLVVLDPGHGGVDPGTVGSSGYFEKSLTLAMALEIKRQIEADGRFRVQLTRDTDIFIPLRDRIAISRAAHADIFISLHADSNFNAAHRGATVYTLSETASDAEAEALATKENKADLIAGVDLTNENQMVTSILIDLAQRETKNQSVRLADYMVQELASGTLLNRNTHRFAGFAVLKAPDVPSVLLELGYLSNKQDEKLLQTKAYRRKMATAILKAIADYFQWQRTLTQG